MPTAVKPLTLFNNTTADANDVEAIVNVLYSVINDLDSVNIDLLTDFAWQGNHSHTQNTKYSSGKGLADTNGNEILTVLAVASAVNFLRMVNAVSGTAPTLEAQGDDANVGFKIKPKGTGPIQLLDGNGNEVLETGQVSSAVNHWKLTNAATGNKPVLEVAGDDANIGATLQAKGTGILELKAAKTGYVDLGDTGTGTVTADLSQGNTFRMRATGNFTLAVSNPKDGQRATFIIRQDGTGSRTVTWPTAFRWLNGTGATDSTTDKPTLTTTANKLDIISGIYDATLSLWWVSVVGFKGAVS